MDLNIDLADLKHIDIKNAGSLSAPVKLGLLIVLFFILMLLGYWFVWSPFLSDFEAAKAKENELRNIYIEKKKQGVHLQAYNRQMLEIERTFGALLKQLPDQSQIDGLLTDINQAGLTRGLEFVLFKPGKETVQDFYAELPIQIRVIGSYHDLGKFATDISKLSRIVTLGEISLAKVEATPVSGKSVNKLVKDSGLITMDVVAKTYRYLDESEIAEKRKQEKDKKRK